MASVVGIGAAVFDILMTVDAFPREDTKLRGLETKFQCGGPCATGLVAISKLGESASYMGTVGDDMYGTFVKAELERYGVDTSCVKVNPGLTFHSVVLLNVSNSSRTCVWNRGEAAAPTAEDVNLDVLKQAKFLHLDGNQLDCAIFAAKKAREMGVTVSMDAGGAYPNIEKLLPLVDVLIPSEEFSMKVTGCATAQEAAAVLRERYLQRARTAEVSQVKLELYAEYATSGVMALYVDWLKHPEYDLEEVAEAAAEIGYGGGKLVLEGLEKKVSKRS